MRGKVHHSGTFVKRFRITPAYAGKSFLHPRRRHTQKDHPRLCGEKAVIILYAYLRMGSPPPMRGKVQVLGQPVVVRRITPAYAGKRPLHCLLPVLTPDHPRLCGEKRAFRLIQCRNMGSPPPMRGKAAHYTGGSIECRITPAYAGKRLSKNR